MVFSLYGFLGIVAIDYNWGSGIAERFATVYVLTLGRVIPLWVNYYGAEATFYFGLFLLSFLVLNRRETHAKNILGALRLGSVTVLLFEFGVYLTLPYQMGMWVIQALADTPLAWFSNTDLVIIAAVTLGVSQSVLSRLNQKNWHEGTTGGPKE